MHYAGVPLKWLYALAECVSVFLYVHEIIQQLYIVLLNSPTGKHSLDFGEVSQ